MYLIEAASGTGKSSLCSYIYGYRNDYQGIINFDETNIKAYSVKQWVDLRKHSLSMLFQDLRIFTELTAIENVQLKNNLTGHKKKKSSKDMSSSMSGKSMFAVVTKPAHFSCSSHSLMAFSESPLCVPKK